MVGNYNRDTSSVTATPSTVTSSSAAFGRWAFGIGQPRRDRRGRTGIVKGRSVRPGGNVLTTLSCSASGIFAICCDLTRPTITRLARTFHSTTTRRRREPYIPLVAFCLRHFLADFIICMCESDFRQAQPISGHVGGLGTIQHREFAMASGEMSRAEFTAFLQSVFGHLGTAPHINNVELGRQGRNRTNVWSDAGVNSFGGDRADLSLHPTVKPVAMVADAIRDCSHRKGFVLDAFVGSGTTLIAAEKTGRRGYGVEIDPLYCDVTIRRLGSVCGLDVVLEGTGQRFAEVEAQRAAAGENLGEAAPSREGVA